MHLLFVTLLVALPGACPLAGTFAPRLYETTIETGLPHLEENLRYATTHGHACLGEAQLASAFPILHHAALKGCVLDHAQHAGNTVMLTLSCIGSATTGTAAWQFDRDTIHGTLDVKLGGKNMTFYQRLTGRAVGQCVPD